MKLKYRLLHFAYCLLPITYCLLQTACQKQDLRDYYFPLKQLQKEPKVYEYRLSTADTSLTIYWYYQTVVQGDSVNFVGTLYNSDFQPMQLVREERTANGMKMKELTFYTEGGAIAAKARIDGGATFPFAAHDSNSVFVNVIHFADPKDSTHLTTLTRNRRFLRRTTYDFKEKNRAAAEFDMKEEQAESGAKQGGWVHIYKIQEIYAQGIGLVFSKRELGGGQFFETKLVDIYPMTDLEKKFKKHLGE